MKRTSLYLHFGLHKTGTTALQYYWQENANTLLKSGIYYPLFHDKTISMGNGSLCVDALRLGNIEKAKKCVDNIYAQSIALDMPHVVLLSSEDFALFDPKIICELFLAFDVLPFCFIRDPLEWSFSAWMQAVKMGCFDSNFEDFLRTKPCQCEQMGQWLEYFPNVKCFSYEKYKHNLLLPCLDLFNVSLKNTSLPDFTVRKNRGLTSSELTLLLTLNKHIKNDSLFNHPLLSLTTEGFFKNATDLISVLRPDSKYAPVANENHAAFLKMVSVLLPINEIVKEHVSLSDNQNPIAEVVSVTDLDICFQVIFENVPLAGFLIAENTAECFAASPARELCPADFSAVIYLARYPDILQLGLDPYQHYLEYGNNEGRVYK